MSCGFGGDDQPMDQILSLCGLWFVVVGWADTYRLSR